MTKQEKIAAMLAASMTTTDGVRAAFRKEQPEIAKKIDARPDLVKEMQTALIRVAAPCFESMSDNALDSALVFFSSPAGVEYQSLSVAALPKLGPQIQKLISELLLKLLAEPSSGGKL